MSRYLLRQLMLLMSTMWLLTLLGFALGHWFPGDFVTNTSGIKADDLAFAVAVESRSGDAGFLAQYVAYVQHLFSGQWGYSLLDGEPIFEQLQVRLGATLEIAILAFVCALIPGILLGVIAALNFRKFLDHSILAISICGYSIPVFWFAQVAILVIAVHWGMLPIAGQINPLFAIELKSGSILLDTLMSQPNDMHVALRSAFAHMLLPTLLLAIMPMMLIIRFMRNAMLDVLQQNFIIAGYAKGLSTAQVLRRHAIPNAMQQLVRQLGDIISLLVTNTLIIEVIFSWPGIGSWLVRAIYERDYPVIQAGLLTIAVLILVIFICLNILHAWRYPQVRKDLYATA